MKNCNGLTKGRTQSWSDKELWEIWSKSVFKEDSKYFSSDSLTFISGFTGCKESDREGTVNRLTDVFLSSPIGRIFDDKDDREAIKGLIDKKYREPQR